jgi:hypothetical protein
MSPIYVPGKVVLSRIQQYPAVLGEPWGGGYFAGYISHTADGNPTHALIVAPVATGQASTLLSWKTTDTNTPDTNSLFDGFANTAAMVTAGIVDHPAANFCTGLSIGGFNDWYLPALLEHDVAYFNLKGTTTSNNTGGGINAYSVPARASVFTSTYPAQTSVSIFAGAESFGSTQRWTSTQTASNRANVFNYNNGQRLNATSKTPASHFVRAFRRIAL